MGSFVLRVKKGAEEMEIDPVCGIDVEPEDCAGKVKFEGKTYYFCSTDCKREFLEEPEFYAFVDAEISEDEEEDIF